MRNLTDKENLLLFGKFIREKRELKGYSQEEVAELIGITQSYYARIELGKRNVDLFVSMKICEVLGTSLKDFLKTYHK